MMLMSIGFILGFQAISTAYGAVCFFPDGVTTDRLGVPCNQTEGAFSACCRPTQEDICQPEGHCYSTKAGYWRNGCTDPTWQTPHCARICLSNVEKGNSSWEVPMTACNTDGSFCCGSIDPQVCCASSNRMFLPANVTQSAPSTNRQNSTLSSSTPSTTSAAGPHASESLSKQAKIGIGIGVPVLVIATAILVYMILAKRRLKKRRDVAASTPLAPAEMEVSEMKGIRLHEKDGSERFEVEQSESQPAELEESPSTAVELPGENVFNYKQGTVLK